MYPLVYSEPLMVGIYLIRGMNHYVHVHFDCFISAARNNVADDYFMPLLPCRQSYEHRIASTKNIPVPHNVYICPYMYCSLFLKNFTCKITCVQFLANIERTYKKYHALLLHN